MIGVGLEELGVEEFVQGKYFDGELYIDTEKKSYKTLGYKRIGILSGISSIMGKKGRDAISKAKEQNINGNLKGDGFQNGGTLIVNAGGDKVLLSYIQEHPADHVPLEDVLKALNIEVPQEQPEGATGTQE